MIFDAPELWVPPRPAIIRPAPLVRAQFPFPAPIPGVGKVKTLTWVADANADNANITIPSAARKGDLAVLYQFSINSAAGTPPTNVNPTGWTQLTSQAADTQTCALNFKVLATSDPGSSVAGISTGTAANRKAILILRGDFPIQTATGNDPHTQSVATDPTSQTIASSGGTAPLVVVGQATGNGGEPSTTGTLVSGGVLITSVLPNRHKPYYAIQNTSLSNLTFDTNDVGTWNTLQSGYLTVT